MLLTDESPPLSSPLPFPFRLAPSGDGVSGLSRRRSCRQRTPPEIPNLASPCQAADEFFQRPSNPAVSQLAPRSALNESRSSLSSPRSARIHPCFQELTLALAGNVSYPFPVGLPLARDYALVRSVDTS